MQKELYDAYISILEEELIPAMGCTEPIAIAYAAAKARAALGKMPERAEMKISPNIIKNVKSVVVPHTGGLRGISAAAAAGIAAGDPDGELEVLSNITEQEIPLIKECLEKTEFEIGATKGPEVVDVQVRLFAGEESSFVRLAGSHTHIVRIEKNGKELFSQDLPEEAKTEETDRTLLTVEQIVEFADCVRIDDIRTVIERQIRYNTAIAEEGIRGHWGAGIGRVLLAAYGDSVHNRAKAYAAAGSDARMSGCELPVVINSGSGNQGITVSLPVIVYAKELCADEETLYRSLVVSNLVSIHLKTGIGKLSAYCGATSAGCGAAAGITYLRGGRFYEIAHTIVNGVAINSGMICDGAKASCAAKIASAVEAGLLGMQMQRQGEEFYGGDGIIVKGVENTIRNVGRLAAKGMRKTDEEIISMMIGDEGAI